MGIDKFHKGKALKPVNQSSGYYTVHLKKSKSEGKHYLIHRLVAQAFIDNTNNFPEVNHKDEDKTNNNVTNLEWCSAKYNTDYSVSKMVQCVETGCIYNSTRDAERETSILHSRISEACLGKRQTAGGYHWQYI